MTGHSFRQGKTDRESERAPGEMEEEGEGERGSKTNTLPDFPHGFCFFWVIDCVRRAGANISGCQAG